MSSLNLAALLLGCCKDMGPGRLAQGTPGECPEVGAGLWLCPAEAAPVPPVWGLTGACSASLSRASSGWGLALPPEAELEGGQWWLQSWSVEASAGVRCLLTQPPPPRSWSRSPCSETWDRAPW